MKIVLGLLAGLLVMGSANASMVSELKEEKLLVVYGGVASSVDYYAAAECRNPSGAGKLVCQKNNNFYHLKKEVVGVSAASSGNRTVFVLMNGVENEDQGCAFNGCYLRYRELKGWKPGEDNVLVIKVR